MHKRNCSIWRSIFILSLFFVFSASLLHSSNLPVEDEYETIIKRIVTLQQGQTGSAQLEALFDKQSALFNNGSFSDIDYKDTSQTLWKPAEHLLRLQNYATLYTLPSSKYYQSAKVYSIIKEGLEFWLKEKPQSTNWWYFEVDTGNKLGLTMLLMHQTKKSLPKNLVDQINNYLEEYCGDPGKWQGANRIDIAKHWAYRGLVLRDDELLKKSTDYIFEPTKVSITDDGIQTDYSYAAHGNQLYIGGYGDVYIDGTIENAEIYAGTQFAMSPEKVQVLHNFIELGYLPVIRGKYRLLTVFGRSATRYKTANLFVGSEMIHRMQKMKIINPAKAPFYDAAIARLSGKADPSYLISPAHRHFWRTDYSIHQRPEYLADTRVSSFRTTRSETMNNENLKGYFMSDGAMFVVVDGTEYSEIIGAWDWSRIPGTTTPTYTMDEVPVLVCSPKNTVGYTDYAGGVSDNKYGATGYIYNDGYDNINTMGRKGWFYFDNEIVCLGAGINSNNPREIATTLNQVIRQGDVTASVAGTVGTVLKNDGEIKLANIDWLHHRKIGYVFPEPQKTRITVSSKQRKQNLKMINTSNPNTSVEKEVFGAWINHGKVPVNSSYAYIIVPNITQEQLAEYDKSAIEILANTDSVQAVKHRDLNLLQVLFYEPAEFISPDQSIKIIVDKPCALMFKNIDSESVEMYIADPTQTESTILVTTILPQLGERQIRITDLPTNPEYGGMSFKAIIDTNTEGILEPARGIGAKQISKIAGDLTIKPIDDSFVVSKKADEFKAFGTSSPDQLVVKSNFDREIFIKFDLNQLKSKLNKEHLAMAKCDLEMTVRTANEEAFSIPIHCRVSGYDWKESILSWANKPAVDNKIQATAQWKENSKNKVIFDVTEAVQFAILRGDQFISFNLSQEGRGANDKHDISFHSKDVPNGMLHPLLRATYGHTTE